MTNMGGMGGVVTEYRQAPTGVDPHIPSPARIYDYLLGGKDNYAADRETADKFIALVPEAPLVARENRAFLAAAVRFLAANAGVRQFIDIGSGLPTQRNVHEVAHEVAPDARVVYVDYDPIVIVHNRALLSAADNVITIQADIRHPHQILNHPELGKLIDLDQPVAVLLMAVLHFVTDDEDPAKIVDQLRQAMAPGSYLVLSHITEDVQHRKTMARWIRVVEKMAEPFVPRSRQQILRFFDGFELLGPGLVKESEWRPDIPRPLRSSAAAWLLASVARKA